MAFVCKLSQLFQFAANSADKNPDRGPYRKKLDRLRARDQPIRFEDLRFRPAEIQYNTIQYLFRHIHNIYRWEEKMKKKIEERK